MFFDYDRYTYYVTPGGTDMLKACDECIILTERDKVLLSMLYNTGCRVSELAGVRVSDFRHLSERKNASVLLQGKWRKERVTPIWNSTAKTIDCYVKRSELQPSDNLIVSNTGHPMTRSGIAQRITKLVSVASSIEPSLKEKNVTPAYVQTFCSNEPDTVWC